tara:strand:- start:1347 stop:1628 length:282 start_codon:yes stop_codon:yes gene_type:complete
MKKMIDNTVIEMTSDEVKAREAEEKAWADGATERKKNNLRDTRKPLLEEADNKINTLADSGGDATSWRKYRQELRDITKASDIDNVTFPSKPS